MNGRATIVALASGRPPSAIAIVRVSGSDAFTVGRALCGALPRQRTAALRTLRRADRTVIDRAIVLTFHCPTSATGEDVVEFHIHGGQAVIAAAIEAVLTVPGVRIAEPGEFTRRAFDTGKLDLTQVEGLADLLAATTEAQRAQAIAASDGALARIAASWRGDWLGLGKRPDGQAAVSGAVVFSNEEDAEVARVIMRGDRRGLVVAFADGLPPAQAAAARRDTLDTPIPDPPASPPFGPINIPPAPVPIEKQARFGGTFDGATFSDPGLGLRLPVANAYRVTINGSALLRATDGHRAMALVVFDFGQSPQAQAQVKASILSAARQLSAVVSYTDATVPSALGPVLQRSVQLADGRLFATVLLPMCARRATLFMAELSYAADVFANRNSVQLHDWLVSLDPKAIEQSEFCRAVDEEWTTELQ